MNKILDYALFAV